MIYIIKLLIAATFISINIVNAFFSPRMPMRHNKEVLRMGLDKFMLDKLNNVESTFNILVILKKPCLSIFHSKCRHIEILHSIFSKY